LACSRVCPCVDTWDEHPEKSVRLITRARLENRDKSFIKGAISSGREADFQFLISDNYALVMSYDRRKAFITGIIAAGWRVGQIFWVGE
jgi:hypothetical protein